MSTIRDVAKLAQVSVATVSRYVNKSGYVGKETAKKVLKAMEELDYQPNEIARSLNKKQSKTIALIVPDITNPFFPELARAVEDVAQIYGYTVILCNSDEQTEKEREYIKVLQNKYIDGFILASNTSHFDHIPGEVPLVVLDRSIEEQVPTVVSNNREGAEKATRHLLDIGCQKIAHIRGPEGTMTAKSRLEGYMNVVQTEPWFSQDLIIDGEFDIEQAQKSTLKLLKKYPDIDGIFAGNDIMAVGALKAVFQSGKRVPEDIAIIGFDGIGLSKAVFPELSTIAQPIYDMGALATRLLLKIIEKQPVDQIYHEMEVELVIRASSKRKKKEQKE